jgi:hypothetical protein
MQHFLQFISDSDARTIILSADANDTIILNPAFSILALTFLREYNYICDWGNQDGAVVTGLTVSGRMLKEVLMDTRYSSFFHYLHTLQLLNQAYEKAMDADTYGIIDVPTLMEQWQKQAELILKHIHNVE